MERPSKKPRIDSKRTPAPTKRIQNTKSKSTPITKGKGKEKPNRIDAKPKPKTDAARPPKPKPKPAQKVKVKAKAKARVDDAPTPPPRSFKIITGSYEKLLYGLAGSLTPSADAPHGYTVAVAASFIFPAHVSCIKAVAASPAGGKWLATGSADEIIKVWDLRRRKEVGGLMHHEGSITQLSFPTRSHLLSSSEDGTLTLFRARDWAVLRVLKGHRGHVNGFSVHPSSKVALSVGRDGTLRMWDLMRGKGCASTKLGKEGERVVWSKKGGVFAVQAGKTVDLYDTKMEKLHTIVHPSRLHDVVFAVHPRTGQDLLLAGGEDGKVAVYALTPPAALPVRAEEDEEEPEPIPTPAPRIIAQLTGHANRVKAIDVLTVALPPSPSPSSPKTTTLVCTASSDGLVRVFDLADLLADGGDAVKEMQACAEYNSKGTRLTCVTFAEGDVDASAAQAGVKRAREDEGNTDDDEDGEEEVWGGAGVAEEDESEDEDELEMEGEGEDDEEED
ncbi:WD40 repeat-like protein [Athelia psychrophila]|uniref:WD40 repeat-like protein n=1 Tax=Athelia psychrophila TaxID=1759441 RepID=A0A166RWM7_9AGAM|nr:WD40 repeat-like protein [Fibularhizoctonia sp. CBS 109695]